MKYRDTSARPNPKALIISAVVFIGVPVLLALILR